RQAGLPRIELTFLSDPNGMLGVKATDRGPGRDHSLEVKQSHGPTEDEIERMLEESIDLAEEDIRQRQLREVRVEADMILNATRESLARERGLLAEGEAARIDAAVAALDAAGGAEDHVAIHDAVEALSRETEPFARRIMDRSLQEALTNRRLEEL